MSVIPRNFSEKYGRMHSAFLASLPREIGSGVFKAKLVKLDGCVVAVGHDTEEKEDYLEFRYVGPYRFLYCGFVTIPCENILEEIDKSLSVVKESLRKAREEFLVMHDEQIKEARALKLGKLDELIIERRALFKTEAEKLAKAYPAGIQRDLLENFVRQLYGDAGGCSQSFCSMWERMERHLGLDDVALSLTWCNKCGAET